MSGFTMMRLRKSSKLGSNLVMPMPSNKKLHQGWKKFKKVITMAEKSFKDGETLKAEELDPAYVDLAKPTKLVKEVWLEQVARQTPGIDSYFVTNSLTSSISLQKRP